MPRRKPSDMQLLTPEQQQELVQRYHNRKDVREANKQLATLVLNWVTGGNLTTEEFMQLFEAGGHYGEYHENPSETTDTRITAQAAELHKLKRRLKDTPLDYMGALELSYVYQRIQRMIAALQRTQGNTMQVAIGLYRQIGETIRQKVHNEMGHWPEAFPIPYGRITGEEPEKLFQLADHQAKLFEED